jgi:hypothetical protein
MQKVQEIQADAKTMQQFNPDAWTNDAIECPLFPSTSVGNKLEWMYTRIKDRNEVRELMYSMINDRNKVRELM